MVNYWFDTFTHLKPFDILTHDKVVELYLKNSNILNDRKLEKAGWNERPINSEFDKLDYTKSWAGFDPVYYNISLTGKIVLKAKADVTSMDMKGLGKDWTHFMYLELPKWLINEYMISTHDNEDMTIARQYITEVEKTSTGWEGDNWRIIEEKYDKLYPERSTYTDFYETHDKIKWKQDFNIEQYMSLKKNGIIYPVCYNSKDFMLKRGTHRAVLLAKTGSDVPIFLQYPNMNLNTDIVYDVTTPEHFRGYSLVMSVDVKNKKLEFKVNDKVIGAL